MTPPPGMFPEKESDEVFEGHLTRLRTLIRKRMAVYGAEEKALRVMLEGEQEEERKRDHEKRQRKEREKLLQKKREIDMMLFGGNYQLKAWLLILVPDLHGVWVNVSSNHHKLAVLS